MMQWKVLVVDGKTYGAYLEDTRWLQHYYTFILRSKHYLLLKVNYAQLGKRKGLGAIVTHGLLIFQ